MEDHRPFDTDVSIETLFKKCQIILAHTKDSDDQLKGTVSYNYMCRYRLIPIGRKKMTIEPVLEDERKAIQFFSTPKKNAPMPTTPKTPSSLVKRMSRVSVSESKSWNISKTEGTKLLLKRAILADKNDKESPKKTTPKKSYLKHDTDVIETPKSSKKLDKNNIEEILSMELKENSEDELPTLIIRQYVSNTPKRKSQVKTDETPKKVLLFEEEEKDVYSTRSGRKTKPRINIVEEISPVKRTPRKAVNRYKDDSDDDFKPTSKVPSTPRTPKTPKTPIAPKTPKTPRAYSAKTPKQSVSKRILTSELTPTLHARMNTLDNIQGNHFYT